MILLVTVVWPHLAEASIHQYAVEASATVVEDPPRLDFDWPIDTTAEQYYVFRKALDDSTWGDPLAILPGTATTFSDSDIAVGLVYEYSFQKNLGTYRDTLSVPDGSSVTFRIRDSWGDGICCHHGFGSYAVTGCDTTYASGGEFESQQVTSFTTVENGSECNRLIVSVTLDIYGQETTWTLTDDQSGDILGSGGPYEPPRFGHLTAGIRTPPVHDRGAILILAEETVRNELAAEIDRLRLDMIGDGYMVHLRTAALDDDVQAVKDLILSLRNADPTISTLLLLGHVPVPYSGDVWSGHENHRGAWPADVYYAELDGPWTDEFVDNETASRPENHNVPGDGKFDQTWVPSDVDLQAGRVDLSDLPAFGMSEIELLRRYLAKNHAFRTGQIHAEPRGLIDDNVGEAYGLVPAATGWRHFPTMFGPDKTEEGDFFPDLQHESYQWAYGCGGSFFTYCGGVGGTGDFAANTVLAVFTSLYGSYFGDWDNRDNVLRAPLAAEGYPLTCFWSGRPIWNLQHLSLGFPIGFCTRLTQNNRTLYRTGDGSRGIQIALMGDPTLGLHALEPVSDLVFEGIESGEILLRWTRPDESVEGFHAYRTSSLTERFVRLTEQPVVDTTYVDQNPLSGKNIYMVRTLGLQTTGSGSYLNLGCGLIDSLLAPSTLIDAVTATSRFCVRPTPTSRGTAIVLNLPRTQHVSVVIHSVSGRLVRSLLKGSPPSGELVIPWDGTDERGRSVPSGMYVAQVTIGGSTSERKIVLVR
jgi:hypothetical protein